MYGYVDIVQFQCLYLNTAVNLYYIPSTYICFCQYLSWHFVFCLFHLAMFEAIILLSCV